MTEPFNWTCPHCERAQVVTDNQYHEYDNFIFSKSDWGNITITTTAVHCANVECNRFTIHTSIWPATIRSGSPVPDRNSGPLLSQRLHPENAGRAQPDYIPRVIVEDYSEACRIRDLSPKASATLSRRCLQGMIRDFCKISENTLNKEIQKLRSSTDSGSAPKGVEPEHVDAIDQVRAVGNIGAHMEADVNLIIPVEPHEAQMLIELIETLFAEWYVARHRREERFFRIKSLAETKKEARNGGQD